MDLARGDGAATDFATRPVAHALLEEGDDRAVGCLVLGPGSNDGLWL